MTGACNSCGHTGSIYVEHDEENPNSSTPYCPICLSEDVSLETQLGGKTYRRPDAQQD